MFIRYCIVIFLSLTFQGVFSQFREGYIIDNKNDTVPGLLKYSTSLVNPEVCIFKRSEQGPEIQYGPEDIKAFRYLSDKYYISEKIPVEGGYKQVFLEWLIKGRASMFTYVPNGLQSRYFILLENDSIYELLNTQQVREKEGRTYQIDKKEYVGALTYYLNDCPALFPQIRASSFTSKSLTRIAKKYHEKTCDTEDCIIYADESRKLRFNTGPVMNTFLPEVHLNNELPEELYTSRKYGFGCVVEISNLSFLTKRLFLRSGIIYSRQDYYWGSDDIYWNENDEVLEFRSLLIPFQLNFQILKSKFTPFAAIGITANIRFNYIEHSHLLMNHITQHFDYNLGFKPLQPGYRAGLGVKYTFVPELTFTLECMYDRGGRFFGTYVKDLSRTSSIIAQCSLQFNLGTR